MTHYELCKKTAERFIKKAHIALYEYSGVTLEQPDVLLFNGHLSTIFEIKMSRSDFKADAKKDCRTKWKPKGYWTWRKHPELEKFDMEYKQYRPEMYYIEAPHLGLYRYYVCPSGLIKKEEIPEGWGLYWYKNGRYYKKKVSKKFKRNLFQENELLCHALRKVYNLGKNAKGIMVRKFSEDDDRYNETNKKQMKLFR